MLLHVLLDLHTLDLADKTEKRNEAQCGHQPRRQENRQVRETVHNDAGGEPSRLFVTDKGLLINAVVWVVVTCFAVYAPPELLPWWRIEL